jgi:hypothetical protein
MYILYEKKSSGMWEAIQAISHIFAHRKKAIRWLIWLVCNLSIMAMSFLAAELKVVALVMGVWCKESHCTFSVNMFGSGKTLESDWRLGWGEHAPGRRKRERGRGKYNSDSLNNLRHVKNVYQARRGSASKKKKIARPGLGPGSSGKCPSSPGMWCPTSWTLCHLGLQVLQKESIY